MTIRTPTGTLRTILPGVRWSDAAWNWTGNETPETLAAHGYIVQPDPPPPAPPPSQEAQDAATVARLAAEHPRLLPTIAALLGIIGQAAKAGVALDDPPTWDGVAAALLQAGTLEAMQLCVAGMAHWNNVALWAGSPQEAYRLLPAMVAAVVSTQETRP